MEIELRGLERGGGRVAVRGPGGLAGRLLVMDTCGAEGSIALVEGGAAPVLVDLVMLPGRTSSERLMPELRAAMDRNGWNVRDLAAVGVVSGPGSFTGVRVGMAAAKGLCEAGGLPMVAVSRLRVLAGKVGAAAGVVHAVLDAGREEFFYGRFAEGEGGIEALLSREDVLAAVEEGSVVVYEEGVRDALAEAGPVLVRPLTAADAISLVLERVERGEFDDAGASDANYLRRTDVEVRARLEERAGRP